VSRGKCSSEGRIELVRGLASGFGPSEGLHVINDAATGVAGMIAIHSTALGPAAGGCRLWNYGSEQELANDAVRLARGMSYKNAFAGLPFGGGKAVLQRPAGAFDRQAMFRVFADAVAALRGAYITAEDVGTTVSDMKMVHERTPYVAGLEAREGKAGGDPSPWTALGVFKSMEAASQVAFGSGVRGLRVAVQGTGSVGTELCRMLAEAGARLILADIDVARARALADALGGTVVSVDEILSVEADVLAPCALGAVLNERSIPNLKVGLVCGAANNQLETDRDGEALLEKGVVYAPDYVVNAGGIINVAAEYLDEATWQVEQRLDEIASRLTLVLKRAANETSPTHRVADEMAQKLIAAARSVAA
jgi:leucine dehydrogenase